jgi:hypothetical protein
MSVNTSILVWASLAFLSPSIAAQSPDENVALRVSMCDLYENPEQYAGKIVTVTASVVGSDLSLDDFSNEKRCSAYMRVHLEFPGDVKPMPGFDLIRDEAFNKFFDDLHKGMNVLATYEGRFDPAFVWRDRKRIRVSQDEEKGYGKKHQYDGRIVLHRISEVVGRPFPRK